MRYDHEGNKKIEENYCQRNQRKLIFGKEKWVKVKIKGTLHINTLHFCAVPLQGIVNPMSVRYNKTEGNSLSNCPSLEYKRAYEL